MNKKSKIKIGIISGVGAVVLTCLIAFSNETTFSFESLIIEQAKKSEQDFAYRFIDLAKAIPFEWDKMYVVDEFYSVDEIKEITGAHELSKRIIVPENFFRVVFAKDNKAVHVEDICWGCNTPKRKYIVQSLSLPIDTTSRLTDSSDFKDILNGGYLDDIDELLGCFSAELPFCESKSAVYSLQLVKIDSKLRKGSKLINLFWAADSTRCAVL